MTKFSFAFVVASLVLLTSCTDQGVQIAVKQTFPIGPGTVIEASVPLNISLSKIDELVGFARDVHQNSKFLMNLEVVNHGPEVRDTKLQITHQGTQIVKMQPYSPRGTPLQGGNDFTYKFDDELLEGQITPLRIAGEVGELPEGVSEAHLDFTITILDGTGKAVASTEHTIPVVK